MGVGDIPEVQAEIDRMTSIVHGHYVARNREAVHELELELDRLERERDFSRRAKITATIAALLLAMRSKIDAPFSSSRRNAARASARRLIIAGTETAGGSGRLRQGGPTIAQASRRAADELEAVTRWRFQAEGRQERLDAAIDDFLRSERARRTPADRRSDADSIRARDDEREAKRRETAGKDPEDPAQRERRRRKEAKERERQRKDSRKAADDRAEWWRDVKSTLADPKGSETDLTVDMWAYRQHSVGSYLAARAQRYDALIAWNPLDEQTTRFCRWVHGKIVKLEKVREQVEAVRQAVTDDDREAAIRAWPMLGFRKAEPVSSFRRKFVSVGLSPYHWRCRTQMRPTRIASGSLTGR